MLLLRLRNRRGFTLVEIMIVVAIIALLAAIAVPNFLRARKRAQGTRIIEDLKILDHAVDLYALETGRPMGFNPRFVDLKPYLKTGTALYFTGADLYGNSYSPFTVDQTPRVADSTYNALSDTIETSLWSPYH